MRHKGYNMLLPTSTSTGLRLRQLGWSFKGDDRAVLGNTYVGRLLVKVIADAFVESTVLLVE
jgi:hypothetical protein